MTAASSARDGWHELKRGLDPEIVRQLAQLPRIEKLSITQIPLVTASMARQLAGLHVEQLWLWCKTTPAALRELLAMPGLRVLDLLHVTLPGRLAGFREATQLREFRANYGMTAHDLVQVAQCPTLQWVAAQNAQLSREALSALLALPELTTLDLEATAFDDAMARRVSRSTTLTSLDIGATRVTRTGLEHLVQMAQLRSMDLWATRLQLDDLRLLVHLPQLEYVSLGNREGPDQLDGTAVTDLLLDCPSLKRVWLDGIELAAADRTRLDARLEKLRLT